MHSLEAVGPVTIEVSKIALFPFLAVLIPICGAFLVLLTRRYERVRNTVIVTTTLATLGIILSMYQPVIQGIKIHGHLYKGIEYSLKATLGGGIYFKVDPVSLLVAGITAFLWVISSIYALSYMTHERARTRYAFFVLLTLAADLGVLLSKDFFSLFLFFEVLGLASALLVFHTETKKARNAGKLYIWFGVIGGLGLLLGILLIYTFTGQINIQPLGELANLFSPTYLKYVAAGFMIFGFGCKAGIFFCHVWLPEAHPVAPTPASALLSGVIIKAGAYGILRTVNTLFAPSASQAETVSQVAKTASPHWSALTSLGYGLIMIGVITMFLGVINALMSHNCKRMLAYHSVSQMGYIVFGLGCAAYLGREGAMGLAGGLYHIVNHALFKGSLFLCVGAVYFRTGELDMYKLGGLWRNMPFTAVACFIAVMGISGVPLFNGFVSKTILHHAAIESIEYSTHLTVSGRPDSLLQIAEILFLLTAFGTFCSNFKMWLFLFIWKQPDRYKEVKSAPTSMKVALFALSAAILFIGIKPNWLLEKFIGPALASFGFEASSHAYHSLYNIHAAEAIKSTIAILYNPNTLSYLGSPDALHNTMIAALEVLGGGTYFILGYRFGWFHYQAPEWFAVIWWYDRAARSFLLLGTKITELYNLVQEELIYFPKVINKYAVKAKRFGNRRVRQELDSFVYGAQKKRERAAASKIEDELEKIRLGIIRRAISRLSSEMIGLGLSKQVRQERLDQVREAASRVADEVMKKQLEAVKKAMRDASPELVAEAVAVAGEKMKLVRDSASQIVTEWDYELAQKTLAKAGGKATQKRGVERRTEEMIASVREMLSKERFNIVVILEAYVHELRVAKETYQEAEATLLERIGSWGRAVVGMMVTAMAEEKIPWMIERRISQKEVEQIRAKIRVYTRDLSFNILLIISVLVICVLLIFYWK